MYFGISRIYAILFHYSCQSCGIAWNAMEGSSSEVFDKFQMAEAVAGTCRNTHGAKSLSCILNAEAACKHTIAGSILNNICVA